MYWLLLFFFFHAATAARIGRFTFLSRELLQEGETMRTKANDLETIQKNDRSFLGKVAYENGQRVGVSTTSQSLSRLQNLLNHFPTVNNSVGNALNTTFYVQMRFKQKERETFTNETSDYFALSSFLNGGENALQHHVTVEDCVDNGPIEAFQFHISPYAYNYSAQYGDPNLLESECTNHSFKTVRKWHHDNSVVATTKSIENECFDNNVIGQEHYRYLEANFVEHTFEPETVLTSEVLCTNSAVEHVTFTPSNTTETFVEEFVLEEECRDNADALTPMLSFNANMRWKKSNRGDAKNVSEVLPLQTTNASVPFYKYQTYSSTGILSSNVNEETHLFANDEAPFSVPTGISSTWNSSEPAFTLTAWVKGHGTVMSIHTFSEVCGKQAIFAIDQSGQPTLSFNCNEDSHASTLLTNTNEWTHVAFGYNGFGTRTIVVDGVEAIDVYHNTTFDYVLKEGTELSNAHVHNEVLVLQNELGDVVGSFAGYSIKDCLNATMSMDHAFFTVENGVCKSSASVVDSVGQSTFHRTVQYRITREDFKELTVGPFQGYVDELLLYAQPLTKETVVEIGRSQNIGYRFDGSSLVHALRKGEGVSRKVSWEQYPNFFEEDLPRSACVSEGDHRYEQFVGNHSTFLYTAEGRGDAYAVLYEPYAGGAENVSFLASATFNCQSDLNLDHKLLIHSYQNSTTLANCRLQETENGLCRNEEGELSMEAKTSCTGTFLPLTNFTWLPDPYEIEYDTLESDCPQTSEIWGTSEALLVGLHGRNTHVYNDHERTFYFKNKYGGDRHYLNTTSLLSVKEWCRGTVSCAGIQQDGNKYFPVENIAAPEHETSDYSGFRVCLYNEAPRIRSAMDCYASAVRVSAPSYWPYVHGDELRSHAWGYVGVSTGEVCSRDSNGTFYWDTTVHGDLLCSDKPNDYYTVPIVQTRWQRDNDTVSSKKEPDCVDRRLDWLAHSYDYETHGTATRPHFQIQGQRSWQEEPVECLYTTNATFQINVTTLRQCRDEAIFFSASGYSFQREGSEFMYMTARHFTHVEDARDECKRLHAHVAGPEDSWDLCSNQEYDCSIDNTCINADTEDNTIFAVAACCMNTGTSCAITSDTSLCTPKHGYESFSFQFCTDERIENASNTTYNVYAPEWNRSEWRAETHSRTYDESYYDIVALYETDSPCSRGLHLSYDECVALRATVGNHSWLGTVYDREKIAGCALDSDGNLYWNRYTYDSAKRVESTDQQFCRLPYELFSSTFHYTNTSCMYLNHELEVTVSSVVECSTYAKDHFYKAISYANSICLLAKERGPCEENHAWTSFFYVEPSDVETFLLNENLEHSVESFTACVLNTTAMPVFKQVPYGTEEHGVLYDTSRAAAYGTLDAAKDACDANDNCTIVYTSNSIYYALTEDTRTEELIPVDPQYALIKHWKKNTVNYHNRTHLRHFFANNKELCLDACNNDRYCAQIMFSNTYCFLFGQFMEETASHALLNSVVMFNERKGAVAYHEENGECWLYKNDIGKSYFGPDGDCRNFQPADHFNVYPLDASLRTENKVVYLIEDADTSLSTTPNVVTEERSEKWCNNREGASSWQAYGTVLSVTKENECIGTWNRHPNLVRINTLQRECEQMDTNAVSFTRNADHVTSTTDGSFVYQKQYLNGYKKQFHKACGSDGERIDYQVETSVLYGESCHEEVETADCQSRDIGYGYAVQGSKCLVYQHIVGSNHSDCRYRHTVHNTTTYHPVSYHNFVEAVDSCNQFNACVGVCEAGDGTRSFYPSKVLPTEATAQCHHGWSGEDCSIQEATAFTHERITNKRFTAIDFCGQMGQELCEESFVPIVHSCVHYKEATNCSEYDFSSEPVAYCCGKQSNAGVFRQEAVFYQRVENLHTCQDPAIEKLGSAVHDHTPKLIDSYTVEHVATGLCKGSTLTNTSECESTCLHASTCSYFSNSTNGSCRMHSTCQNGFAYHKGDYNAYRIRQKAGVFDTPQDAYADLIGDCKYHYAVEEQPIVEAVPFHENTDSLRDRWHCERAFIDHKRNFTWSIHSFNESFQFDIMEAHYIEDSRRMYEALKPLNVSVSSASTLDECLESASNQYVVSFNETSLTCMHYYDPWEALKGTYTLLGSSRKSSGYYEGPFQMTLDFFESTHLTTYNPHVTVNDWTLSTAKDDCEVLCEQHADCKAFILDQQNCHLHRLPNQTTIDYMRSVQGTGHVLVYVRTTAEFLCRHNGAAWDLKETIVETTTMHPLVNTEALPEAVSLAMCKHAFLNDARVPRLDTLLYDESTGECRISLLRNQLVRTSNVSEPNNFTHYVLSETYQNPFRTTATLLETEDIARDTCFTYHQLLTGRDASSWAAAPFWERERDVIRHEILEEDCGVTLPPQLPKLAYAWEKNQQGSLTFNVKEETCKASDLFLSWRTNVAGKRRIVVNNESECMEYSSNDTSATYLGNELIEQADYRSSCNGIVDENNFERIFADQPIRMLASEDNRIAVREASIDACAATAANYYAHFNRSTETKVFEYHFTKEGDNCAYFMSEECAGLCFPETNPSASRVGFSSFRLDSTLGMTAASCWILSVMDSTEGNQYCRKCPIGKFNSRAASNCLPCQQGRYADETGLKACKSCPEGTFSFGSGSTHCHHCPKGTYQDEMGERQCKICAAGQYEQNGTCVNCPVGKAAPNNFPENKAGGLQYTGTSYRGGLMYYDPRFDYSGVHGVSNKKNEEGVYMHGYSPIFTSLRNAQAKAHDSEDDCVVCEAGTYSDQAGASICKACQSGLYQDQTEQTSCKSCNTGEVARTGSKAGFHYFMPQQCFSAELLGEIRDSMQQKTMEDVGLINEVSTPHVEACFDTCQQTTSCLFVSYKDTRCQLFRKCDEIGESGWASYRLSSSFASLEDSSSLEVSTEIQLYGPSHHECMEVNMVPTPETYILRENRKITEEGTIGTALTYDSAISQCNAMIHCIGFTYGGSVDASTRTFSENDPILLKSQGDHVSSIGFQAWFKEEPVETKLDCQQQCAQNTHCNFMEWNTTKVCRKWQSCTLRKKEDLTAAESNLYSIGRARSFALFAFQGRWPCDADVHVNQSRSECEEEANRKGVPMFYHEEDTGACHVYVSYTSEGIKDLYTEEIKRSSKVCKSGSVMPNFDSAATGSLYLLGSTQWDVGATTCSFCPAGLHTEISDAVVCRQCRSGTYDKFPDTSSPCQACEIGRFQDESGQSTCKACSAGRFQDTTGGTRCKASGQGYKTIGQGFPLATQTELRTKSSGPLQNNTFEDAVDLNIEGATGREICGRNSFAAGYENVNCKKVPTGAVSVTRERNWRKEASACVYDNSSVVGYRLLNASMSFYDGDIFNRMGMHSIDDCIDFVNEQSTVATAAVIAVSFGQGSCQLFTETTDGVVPDCMSDELYHSASLNVGETQYDSDSSDIDSEWLQKWTPHEGVRFVSPYQCRLINYYDVGDYFSAKDCINACRQQTTLNKAACRYVSYSSSDNRCFFVNWEDVAPQSDGTGSSNKIFENTLANIEVACSYGSRTVPLDTTDSEVGSGGYRMNSINDTTTSFEMNGAGTVYGETMEIIGRNDKFGFLSLGLGGDRSESSYQVEHESMYSSTLPPTVNTLLSGTVTLPTGHYSIGKSVETEHNYISGITKVTAANYDFYFVFVNEITCENGQSWSWDENGVASDDYESYGMTVNNDKSIEITLESNSVCELSFANKRVATNYRCTVGDFFGTYYIDSPPTSSATCYKYVSDQSFQTTSNGVSYTVQFGAFGPPNRPRNNIIGECDGQCGDSDGEWKGPDCDTNTKRNRTGFESNCRWSRRRFYDRIKTSLLQDHTLPTNVFPDYNLNGGYQGDNLLRTLGFYNFVDHNDEVGSSSGPLHISYDKVTHISYDHDSIMPLFDVGTNDDDFDRTDLSFAEFRATKGANAFEYCSGSTTQRSAPFLPRSCDDLGYPFVIDSDSSHSGTEKICMKASEPSTKCCIGPDCTGSPIARCMDSVSYSGLTSVAYEVSQYLSFDQNNADILLEHSDVAEDVAVAYAKDSCSQLGVFCIGASVKESDNEFVSYAHGQTTSLKMKQSGDRDLILKLADFTEYGQATVQGAVKEDGIHTLNDCYTVCLRTAFCEMFSFRPDDNGCFIQRDVFSGAVASTTHVLFKLYMNVDDQSKAQFCIPCDIGTTASSANRGGTGVCQGCQPGEISSTSDLFVAEEQVGLAAQEECKPCPAGMMYLAITSSCIACPKGFTCSRTGSYFGSNVVQCKEHEYSTSSLIDFSGEDVSTVASLRCASCTAGKYSNMKGSEYCEKCPKGFFSTLRSACQPCPVGKYTLTTASEECFQVESHSFIAWPASTLSDKRLCESSDCSSEAESRACIGTEDAFCQACPEIRPGHKTYFDGQTCRVETCDQGYYSTAGCIGQDCCIKCTSTCKAGQHSVGCGDPVNDLGGSTQNTQCQDCPVNSYTQFDAIEAPCVETGVGPNFGSQGTCEKCAEAPHIKGTGFTTKSPFKYLTVTHPQTHTDQRRCAAGDIDSGSPTNSFLPEQEPAKQCCSAAAYKCIPCRSSEKVSYSYSYNIGGTTHRWGRTRQPAWSTDGLTGQTFCQSYWYVWNKATRDAIVKFDAKYAPSPAPSSCFPSVASVETPEGKKAIYEIKVGDFVLSHDGFSEVYLLGHADNETLSDYVRITTNNGTSLRISREHFILSNGRYVYAKDVKKGDRLAYGETAVRIETEKAKGLWNPFTIAGTIVVDGILASCHSDWFLEELPTWMRPSTAIIPSIYQTAMAPARKIYHRNSAWVKRFTKSFKGKAIGEHSLTDILKRMWTTYWGEVK